LGNLISVPFAGSPVKCLAAVDDVVVGSDCLFDRCVAIRTVSVDQVEILEIQAFQTAINALNDVFAGLSIIIYWVVAMSGTPIDLVLLVGT